MVNRWCRAFWSVALVGGLLLAVMVLPNSALFAGKAANLALNKAAVKSDTPYIVLGMGCFWGSEKRMQALAGVLDVEAGYAGGDVVKPSYEALHETEAAIAEGKAIKNHAEVVKVYFDPKQTNLEQVLIQFWESHNPTQGNRQGNDVGSNYRSAVFYQSEQERQMAEKTRAIYQGNLQASGIIDKITTEIAPLKNYTSAEDYHQDYLAKNPLSYCGLGGTGVAYVDPKLTITPARHSTPLAVQQKTAQENWVHVKLNDKIQLIAFEAVDCGYCKQFDKDILAAWQNHIPLVATNAITPPQGWKLSTPLFATPTIVLFKNQQEVSRYTGYQGSEAFWRWLAKN